MQAQELRAASDFSLHLQWLLCDQELAARRKLFAPAAERAALGRVVREALRRGA